MSELREASSLLTATLAAESRHGNVSATSPHRDVLKNSVLAAVRLHQGMEIEASSAAAGGGSASAEALKRAAALKVELAGAGEAMVRQVRRFLRELPLDKDAPVFAAALQKATGEAPELPPQAPQVPQVPQVPQGAEAEAGADADADADSDKKSKQKNKRKTKKKKKKKDAA
jgi:hypothetical protein